MRLNLSVKFFIAFLATSITIVAVMVAAMQYSARKNFTDYLRNVEAMRLEELSLVLQEEYQASDGWQRLRTNPERWRRLLRPLGSAAYAKNPPAIPPGFESTLKHPPLPPPPLWEGRAERMRDPPGRRPPPFEQGGPPQDGRDRNPERPPLGIEHRLALFDENREPLLGRAESTQDHTLQAIAVDGKTVGWLGLKNEELPSDPLDTAFLRQQAQAFYLVGALMLVLAAVVAFLLSRHLLAPVRELIRGTRSLTSRRFDARIRVTSTDELGQLARDFNQMAQTLQQYEQLRQQWISDIAHELRTPLSILRGEIEALQDGIRETSAERLDSLHAEVVHMSKIVGNLHDLSLAESAALLIKQEPVNLVLLVRSCLQKFLHRFDERGITLADELGSAEAVTIPGDADRLMQVVSNILENTLRYTDSPGRLTVREMSTASEVLLQFADTGPGVPGDALPRLFDRLYRVDPSRSRAYGGSGLGLAICKTIIEAHGGRIKARHAPVGGLRLEITLPLHNTQARKAGDGNGA